MSRRALAATLFGLILAPTPALADGATIDFQEEYVEPGQLAEAVAQIWLGRKDVASLEEGPFYAYLLPSGAWIRPPRIPPSAVPIGEIAFAQTGPKKGTASVSFVVPQVGSASYGIYYCNDPCEIATVGDLTGGWIRVARSAEEAHLLDERERFERRADALEFRLERAKRQVEKLGEAAPRSVETSAGMLGSTEITVSRRFGGLSLLWAGLAGLALGSLIGLRRVKARRSVPSPASPVEEAEQILEQEPSHK
ncbi:MAG: hypothetical protein ACRDH9_04220 [Actinomycetota bacterium]